MKPALWIGIVLIILGTVSLVFEGFSYRTRDRERVLQVGPIKVDATVEEEHRVPIPRILGFAAIAGGVALVVMGAKART